MIDPFAIDEYLIRIIRDASEEDPFELSLKLQNYPEDKRRFIAEQVRARQKARYKIPSFYSHSDILYPPVISVEQASSEFTASYKSRLLDKGIVIDMTGGMGVDAYFLSTQADGMIYLEKEKALADIAEHNFRVLNAGKIQVICQDSLRFIEQYSGKADYIFLDPSRRVGQQRFFKLEESDPDVLRIKDLLLDKAQQVMIKLSPFLDISYLLDQFREVAELHVVARERECKEILLLLNREAVDKETSIITCAEEGQLQQIYSSSTADENNKCRFQDPEGFLYDPNVAIRKAGLFRSLCHHFSLSKIAPNSHLYTSDQLIQGFPGRAFKIINLFGFHEFYRNRPVNHAVISIRNFPYGVAAIREKSGIIEGDEWYIFGTRKQDNTPVFIQAQRIY